MILGYWLNNFHWCLVGPLEKKSAEWKETFTVVDVTFLLSEGFALLVHPCCGPTVLDTLNITKKYELIRSHYIFLLFDFVQKMFDLLRI